MDKWKNDDFCFVRNWFWDHWKGIGPRAVAGAVSRSRVMKTVKFYVTVRFIGGVLLIAYNFHLLSIPFAQSVLLPKWTV